MVIGWIPAGKRLLQACRVAEGCCLALKPGTVHGKILRLFLCSAKSGHSKKEGRPAASLPQYVIFLQGGGFFDGFKGFDNVAYLHVVEVFKAHAALVALHHFLGVVLEALE